MNIKTISLAVTAVFFASAAQAASTNFSSAGCGLGSILFKGKSGKAHLVLAATTNGTMGNQTFGISSETLECTSDGVVKQEKRAEVYAAANFQRLSKEIAQGGGEYLGGLADLLGKADKSAFFARAQARYETLPMDDSSALLAALKTL